MDKLAAMRLLVRIVQTESFTQGAKAEGISTATATQRIANFERYLNTKLLNRSTRGVSLTQQGEQCFRSALKILDEMANLELIADIHQESVAGIVRINCNNGIGKAIVLPALIGFKQKFPDIRLHIVLSDARANFIRDKVDFSIRIGGLEDQDLIMRNLGSPKRVIVASPTYLTQHGIPITPEDLHQHQLIDFLLPDGISILPWEFQQNTVKTETVFDAGLAINDADARVKLAVLGEGLVQTLDFIAAPYLRSGELIEVLQDWQVDAPTVSILYPRNRHLPRRVVVTLDYFSAVIGASTSGHTI